MRAVLDPSVVISALLSPGRAPASIVRHWLYGSYELVVSPLLLAEITRTFDHPTIRDRVDETESEELVEILRRHAQLEGDANGTPILHSVDPGDDYLIALAGDTRSVLVSGDQHLLDLREHLPVLSPSEFLAQIEAAR